MECGISALSQRRLVGGAFGVRAKGPRQEADVACALEADVAGALEIPALEPSWDERRSLPGTILRGLGTAAPRTAGSEDTLSGAMFWLASRARCSTAF